MKKLDKDKDEVLRIYKNASQKKHPGKCVAFYDLPIDTDRTILEWKALGFTVTSEVSNTALSAVNGAIDIAKAVPSVVSEIARAVGNLGTFGSAPMGAPPQSESGGQAYWISKIASPVWKLKTGKRDLLIVPARYSGSAKRYALFQSSIMLGLMRADRRKHIG